MFDPSQYIPVFQKYFPPETVDYCYRLWVNHRFKFVVSKKRATKLGDYRYNFQTGYHTISVNGNLSPYSFLVTYLHEIAHLTAMKKYAGKVLPHGKEWKQEFRNAVNPLLMPSVLPADITSKIKTFIVNPRATSCSPDGLFEGQKSEQSGLLLKDIHPGHKFEFRKRIFVKETVRRTRSLCLELKSRRKYFISEQARVVPLET